jgi:hypothetical protein
MQGDRILTIEMDDGTLEDVAPEYVHECLREWGPTISFFDDWEAGLFSVTLSEIQAMPCVTHECRRIHREWLNEQRREQRERNAQNNIRGRSR